MYIISSLLFVTSVCFSPSYVWADTSRSVVQAIDEDKQTNLEIKASYKGEVLSAIKVNAWAPFQGNKSRDGSFPENLAHGIEIYVDGVRWQSNNKKNTSLSYAPASTSMYSTGPIKIQRAGALIEIRLYGQTLSRYKIDSEGIKAEFEPRQLSRYQIRSFGAAFKSWTSNYSYSPKLGAEHNPDLKDWIERPTFLEMKNSPFTPIADLHTHLAGAVATVDLVRIAEKLQLPYPVKDVKSMMLDYKKDAVFIVNGEEYIPFSKSNISFSKFHDGHDYFWASLFDGLELDPGRISSFKNMENIYKMRDYLVKNPKAFAMILDAIARDYARNGTKYAELSFYSIVKPAFLSQAETLIPAIEKKYNVKLRFLVGMRRHNNEENFNSDIALTKQAMKQSRYVVGVDFMGEETNATDDFSSTIKKVVEMRNEYPDMAVRVHAGENPNHPDNILRAIELGATRIGHGIYGVTDKVIALAKEKNVIIEFNLNSNLALNNIAYLKDIRAATLKYINAGVRVTFGTDGHGIYHTSPQSEMAVARALGFSDAEFIKIRKSDESYIKKITESFPTLLPLEKSYATAYKIGKGKVLENNQFRYVQPKSVMIQCRSLFKW